MTVGALRGQMSADEFVRWSIYYQRKAQREELAQLRGGKG
jgi:hypothetical protein